MPKEISDICDCKIYSPKIPILPNVVIPDIDTIAMIKKGMVNRGITPPKTNVFLRILSPADCRYCISFGKAYFCYNQERVEIYKRERR